MKQLNSVHLVLLILLIAWLSPPWNTAAGAERKPGSSGFIFAERTKINTIQVLSSSSEKEIVRAARVLDRIADGVHVEEVAGFYILRIGLFPDSQEGIREGLALLDEIRKSYPKAFLRPIYAPAPSVASGNPQADQRIARSEWNRRRSLPTAIQNSGLTRDDKRYGDSATASLSEPGETAKAPFRNPDRKNFFGTRPLSQASSPEAPADRYSGGTHESVNAVNPKAEGRFRMYGQGTPRDINDILKSYPPGAGVKRKMDERNPRVSPPPAMSDAEPVSAIRQKDMEIQAKASGNKEVIGVASDKTGPLTLRESIMMALKQSVIIKSSKEGILGAEYAKKEAFTNFLPRLSSSYSYTRLNEPPVFRTPDTSISLPVSSVTSIRIPSVELNMGTKDNYAWALEVKQPLFAGGGILANYMACRTGEEIARAEETTATQDVIQEVKVSYYNVLKARSLRTVAIESLERLQSHRDMARSLFEVGVIARNDYLAVEVEVANGEQNLVKAQNGVELAQARFNTALRRPLHSPVELVDALEFRPIGKTLEFCIDEAMIKRPEIKAVSLKVKQAGYLVNAARSEYFPSVSFVGHYELSGDTPGVNGADYQAVSKSSDLPGNTGRVTIEGSQTRDRESWYLMAVASWNFWEWGKTSNRVGNARSREMQVNYALAGISDQISLEVTNAWLAIREAEKQISVARKVIDEAQESFLISMERYQDRTVTTTDVLDAQTRLTKAHSDYYNALGDYSIGLAKLERAMGVSS